MIATVHPIATDAGVEVFRGGGNAVDAAVTAALTLGVVDGENSGIGGGCLILIRTADGKFTAIDGRETAPAAAHRDMFVRDGKPMPTASQTGPLASGVPGALAAYKIALERCGTIKLSRALAPGIKAASEGFEISASYAAAIRSVEHHLSEFPGSRAVFFHADGKPIAAGERLVQADLANTYRQIAEHGADWFYRGEFAKNVGDWMAANGGILTAADFAAYEAKVREPLHSTYRGYEIVGFPPPSSGGIHVAQVLNILENFDLRAIAKSDPLAATHITAEAFKLAFADRAYWLGDADFVAVPRGLIDKDYAKELAAQDRSAAGDRRADARLAAEFRPGCVWPAHDAHRGGRCGRQLGGDHGHGQHHVRLEGDRAGHGRRAERRDGRLFDLPRHAERVRVGGRGEQQRGARQAAAFEHEPHDRARRKRQAGADGGRGRRAEDHHAGVAGDYSHARLSAEFAGGRGGPPFPPPVAAELRDVREGAGRQRGRRAARPRAQRGRGRKRRADAGDRGRCDRKVDRRGRPAQRRQGGGELNHDGTKDTKRNGR